MGELFVGSAVSAISVRGDLALHDPFCITIQSRAAKDLLYVGFDTDTRCMIVYDRNGAAGRRDRCDNRPSNTEHDSERRRMFGFAAPTRMDGRGRIAIAPWMRRRGNVGHRTLLIGMGDYFEVWDLDQVIDEGPSDVRALAALHLAATARPKEDHA